MARESRHYEIRPEGPCALPEKDFSRSPSVHRFDQSKLVEAVSGTDITDFSGGKNCRLSQRRLRNSS